jgi:hypothetical protein
MRTVMVFNLHFLKRPRLWGSRTGSPLLTWTQDTTVAVPQALTKPKPRRKHSLLPILIVLFLVSYGLMALLAVEQDRTIASQRALITSLFSDSTELSSLKGSLARQSAQAKTQAEERERSQAQTPSTQDSLNKPPLTQDPPGGNTQSSKNASKLRKQVPRKPPIGIADTVDGRRIMKSI